MIGGFNNAIYGRPGRDEEIEKVIASIRAAGKVGLPVIEYNWYAHRAMEGYFEETDDVRPGVGWTGFDYDLVRTPGRQYSGNVRAEEAAIKFRDLPPLANEGAHTLEEIVGHHHLLSEESRSRSRKGGSPAGAASQRSARAHQPRIAADHGQRGGVEAPHRNRQEPGQRQSPSIAA